MKKEVEAYVCDHCEKPTLDKKSLYKCIHCGKDVCDSVNCCYEINVTVYHNIPNGIPFLRTQSRYRICQDCHKLNGAISKELYELIMPKPHGDFYRHGHVRDGEKEWVRVKRFG